MQEPLISVIVPTFNRYDGIQDTRLLNTVQSVLNQSHRNLELIVVDDCSKTPAAYSLATVTDPRLKIIHHEQNQDVSAARNTGVSHAQGTWVAFLDHDDLWQPEKLAQQLAFMKRHNCVVSVTDFLSQDHEIKYDRHNSRQNPDWLVLTGCIIVISSMLIRKDVLTEIGPFDPVMPAMQDWDFSLRCYERNHKVAIVPQALTIYAGAHSRGPESEIRDLNRMRQKHITVFPEGSPERKAFDAGLLWKAARIEFSGRHYTAAAAKLGLAALRHPVHLARYARVILEGPVRHFFSQLQSVHPRPR